MSGKNSTEHINEAMNEQVTAKPEKIATADDAGKFIGLESNVAYMEAESFSGNPYSLLGTVIEIRKQGGICPDKLNSPGVVTEFSPFKIPGIKIDESSKIKEPNKRQSILVNKKLSVDVSFLNYLSAQFEGESSFSLLVFDQANGLVDRDDQSWSDGVGNWKIQNKELFDDDEICYLFAVIGFVQKYVIRKTYKKFDAKAKGGAFGVNIEGSLYTSSEDYSLDIRYGLHPVILKRPPSAGTLSLKDLPLTSLPTAKEFDLFCSINEIKKKGD
ncbi:hypothetical protein [Pedobacter panaciterrae]|uniref:hypothetical protein n=1 Tax=Pedobacter panaciterrae TaxID=363849 RepID=UPI00259785A0|nr:hypothetical protein [uncultured Pedobacter sp.]